MTHRDKQLQSVRNNPKNVSLVRFEALVNSIGYIEEGSKHPKAIISEYTLTYKRENPVKACYVRDLLDIIDSLKK